MRYTHRAVTVDDLLAIAASIDYVWTEYTDEDVSAAADEAIEALRKLARIIDPTIDTEGN